VDLSSPLVQGLPGALVYDRLDLLEFVDPALLDAETAALCRRFRAVVARKVGCYGDVLREVMARCGRVEPRLLDALCADAHPMGALGAVGFVAKQHATKVDGGLEKLRAAARNCALRDMGALPDARPRKQADKE
jgi:hypothetical protein